MVSLIDPFGLLPHAAKAARVGLKVAVWTERQVLAVLRSRLDATAPRALGAGPLDATAEGSAATAASKMAQLLAQALSQNSASSRQLLFDRVLDQILPDEARILGALSDGGSSPLLHVYARTRAGLAGEARLENASLIGRTANLGLPHLTPTYVSHLIALGLLETGPEDASLKAEYEILAADTAVLRAVKQASRGPIPARVDKYVIRLSALGIELCAATLGEEP